MRILLTNDDGIFAAGIQTLCKKLEEKHEVVVVAPDQERSATGHAITINSPLRATEMEFEGIDSRCLAVNGTPADCVKLAVESLLKEKVDLLISGINSGPNLGYDVVYSGTVSAAVEGLLIGIPSIAVSLATYENWRFEPGADFIPKFLEEYSRHNLSSNILININLPDPEKAKGEVKITKLGGAGYENSFEQRRDPRGNEYYWLVGETKEVMDQETDLAAVNSGYISVTPLEIDLTAEDKIEELKKWNM